MAPFAMLVLASVCAPVETWSEAPAALAVDDHFCHNVAGTTYDFTMGWLPFWGSLKDSACCLLTHDQLACTTGTVFLVLDVTAVGSAGLARSAAKTASLATLAAKVAKATKWFKKSAKVAYKGRKLLKKGSLLLCENFGWFC